MWALDAKEIESSSKIDLRDVSWWMSIRDADRPRPPMPNPQKKGASS